MSKKLKTLLAVYLLTALVLGGVIGVISALIEDQADLAARVSPFVIPATIALGFFATVYAIYVSARWMSMIDEAAREAHKTAWYWGGSACLTLAMPLYFLTFVPSTATWTLPAWINGRTDPLAYLVMGMALMFVLMLVGYTVVWAWWWARRR